MAGGREHPLDGLAVEPAAGRHVPQLGGRHFPAMQAAMEAIPAKTAAELGASAAPPREAGRAVGRGDRIAAALGLAPQPGPSPAEQDLPLT